MRDPKTRAARMRKRAEGVFYTPDDVANYMVIGCLDSLRSDGLPTVYDPACGTGVFLRAALRELSRRHPDEDMSRLALESLFGTDIASWPLDASGVRPARRNLSAWSGPRHSSGRAVVSTKA